jgi:outer membrane protein assembly factor BamA
MKQAAHFGFLLLAWLSLPCCCSPLTAQLPKGLEQCLPYPTLAQELLEMRGETQNPSTDAEEVPRSEIRIISITFVGGANLSRSLRENLTRQIRTHKFYDDPPLDWLEELQEVGIRGHLQDIGYFRAKAAAAARRVGREDHVHDYSVTLHVDPGPQYRLGKVRFASADPDRTLSFSSEELRPLLAVDQGELFKAREIRAAQESITRFYGSKGFIDCVPAPETLIDEQARTIDLTLRIDEGTQYRVGKVEMLGISENAKSQLKLVPQAGQVLDMTQVQTFYSRNRTLLPTDRDELRPEISRDTRAGFADMIFDFWSFPSCAGLTIAQMPASPHR